jgi:hypothetical protein
MENEEMIGRRQADKWDSLKNYLLLAGILIQTGTFVYWVGTYAKQQDINVVHIKENRRAISGIVEQISNKHMTKVDVKDFVDRQIEPINDKLDKIDDNVITLMRAGGVHIREYNMDK